jgi:multidrug resistance efflux pump
MNKSKLLKGWADMKSKLMQKRVTVILLAAIAVIAVIVVAGCVSKAADSTAQAAEVTPVILPDTVIAEGHLVPVASTWLSFQTTGRVAQLLVNEGDAIKKGQTLVVLEGSDRAQAELTAAESANFLAQQNLSDAKKSDVAKSQAELALAKAKKAYDQALSDYWNLTATNGSDEQIALLEAQVALAQDKVDKLQKRYKKMAELEDDDPAKASVKAQLEQAKIDLQNLQDLLDYYKDTPDANTIAVIDANLSVAKANLEQAQRDYDRVKDGPSAESLAAIQAAADQAQAAVDQAQWAYDQLVLKAPYDGTFVRCDLTVGQFITVGQQAAQVADFSSWRIETDDLDENNVTRIDMSKPVTITADALTGVTFTGAVDSISEYYTDDNGDVIYTVKIKLDDPNPQLRWGMTMEVTFQTLPAQ